MKSLIAFFAAFALMFINGVEAKTLFKRAYHPQNIRVVDGDTVVVTFKSGERKIRVYNYDTPELEVACEKALAMQARDALIRYTSDPKFYIRELRKKDKYGRTLAGFFIGKKDIATIMEGQGFAKPYSGGKKQPWC